MDLVHLDDHFELIGLLGQQALEGVVFSLQKYGYRIVFRLLPGVQLHVESSSDRVAVKVKKEGLAEPLPGQVECLIWTPLFLSVGAPLSSGRLALLSER